MSIKTIASKGRKFYTDVANTVCNLAIEIGEDIWNTFGEDLTKDDAQSIGDAIGGDVGPRVSEWKVFAEAVPFGMVEALRAYPKGELTRVDMFGLARAVKRAADYTHVKSTVADFIKSRDAKKKGLKGGRSATLEMGLGVIKNSATSKHLSKTKLNAFRRELAQLCEKYGVTY